jgi:hypothetical protein
MMHNPEAWSDWLRSFRERFIAKQGWSEREAKLRIRDGWACIRDGRVHVLDGDDQRPADAVPVFQMLTPGGWELPIWIQERLTGLLTKAVSSQRSPRDIVMGLLSQVEHAGGPGESDEIKQKRHSAAFWAHQLLDACEDESLAEVSGTDVFWQVPLYAYQAGYRRAILELYQNPKLFGDLTKAQAFQSGRDQDELTRRLEASWLELRVKRGRRTPKPREVAEAAGGKWNVVDAFWQFGKRSMSQGALCQRLKDIRHRHPA